MSRITWNAAGSRFYEAGVDRGVLYIGTAAGVPWVGLISVDENPTGGEAKAYYIDGEKYLNLSSTEEFEATIKAYTYPVEFSECDGSSRVRVGLFFGQQGRTNFGFSYRTKVGNDLEGVDHGYKLHLVYNALATPSSKSVATFGDSPEASDFSWNLTTKSRKVSGYRSTAHIIVDSRYTHPVTLTAIEDLLYGTDSGISRLPTPEELVTIFDIPVVFQVTDNGDDTFTVAGPGDTVLDIGLGKFVIDYSTVVDNGDDTFTISA
jgi:hypothetical protein